VIICRLLTQRNLLFSVAALSALATPPGTAAAADEITVFLESGRSFTGYVDARSDAKRLVLRFEGAATKLWRTMDWSRVTGGEYQAARLSAEALAELAGQLASKAESLPDPREAAEHAAPPVPPGTTQADQVSAAMAASERVQSIAVDAVLVNWDADVEADGLELQVVALDGRGRAVPARGTLEVQLIGVRPAAANGRYVHSRGEPLPRIGTWTRAFATVAGSPGGVFRLPFQAIDPQVNTEIGPFGLVHARLVLPGHGVFEATVELVRIRPFSPIRDRLEQLDGRRYFDNETTASRK